jgi:tetratricopeptide (TPR) repeat protein
MTRRRRIALIVAILAIAVTAGVGATGFYYWIDFQKGTRLANDGYLAGFGGDTEREVALLSEALRKTLTKYQRSIVCENRGAAFNLKWRFDQAAADFTDAIRLNPKLSEAYAGRGFAYLRKGEPQKAITDLTEAIRLDANSQYAYYSRGLVLLQRGETERALADFNEAVRCNPNSAEALVMRGLCYVAKNDLNRALASFDGAVAVNPMNAMAYMERSNLYSRKGDWEKRDRDYQEAWRLNPNIEQVSRDFTQSIPQQQWRAWSSEYATRSAGKDYNQLFLEAQAADALASSVGRHHEPRQRLQSERRP